MRSQQLRQSNPPLLRTALRTTARELGVPMRDFDAATRKFVKMAARELPPQMTRDESGGFFVDNGQICKMKIATQDVDVIPLCNFEMSNRSTKTSPGPDGAEQTIVFGIEGKLDARLHRGTE